MVAFEELVWAYIKEDKHLCFVMNTKIIRMNCSPLASNHKDFQAL